MSSVEPALVPLSADDPDALIRIAHGLAGTLRRDQPDIRAVANGLSLQTHRRYRAAVIADGDALDLAAILERLGSDERATNVERGEASAVGKIAFTFSGQGSQWWAMARQLMEGDAAFRSAVNSFDAAFAPLAGWRVADELIATKEASRIDVNPVTQAALVALHIGLAAVWRARGVVPEVVIGHSLGEISAAFVAGALALDDVARLVHQRGLIPERAPERGSMAAVALGEKSVRPFLVSDDVVIAAFNADELVTLSGRTAALEAMLRLIAAERPGTFIRKINTGFAWHSKLLDPVEAAFRAGVGDISSAPPKIPFLSTVSPGHSDPLDADYWWSNLRQPVRYRTAVRAAAEAGIGTFVEIGPHRTLSQLTREIAGPEALVVQSLNRKEDDRIALARATARLFVHGHAVDWSVIAPPAGTPFTVPPSA